MRTEYVGLADAIQDAHRVMQVHLPGEWRSCRSCGESYPCMPRRDARSLLIRSGRLVLARVAPWRTR